MSTQEEQDIRAIVSKGRLDLLIIYHEEGGNLYGYLCKNAARNGHLECIKYLRENGCPWDEETCSSAAFYGHLDCLQYAYENGCPYPNEFLSTIVKKILIPKWRDSVKIRFIIIYWMERSAQSSCAENGRARNEDINSFENDFNNLYEKVII